MTDVKSEELKDATTFYSKAAIEEPPALIHWDNATKANFLRDEHRFVVEGCFLYLVKQAFENGYQLGMPLTIKVTDEHTPGFTTKDGVRIPDRTFVIAEVTRKADGTWV